MDTKEKENYLRSENFNMKALNHLQFNISFYNNNTKFYWV